MAVKPREPVTITREFRADDGRIGSMSITVARDVYEMAPRLVWPELERMIARAKRGATEPMGPHQV